MKGKRALSRGLWTLLGVSAALYLGRLVVPGTALYETFLSNLVLTAIASPVKLLFRAVAIVMAWRVRSRLEPGNPSRAAWATLAAALGLTLLAQLYLAPFQLRLHESPFPSGADVFFVLSYPRPLVPDGMVKCSARSAISGSSASSDRRDCRRFEELPSL